MQNQITVEDLGYLSYKEAWEYQKAKFNNIIENKLQGKATENNLLLVEHPHVYTLGKHGKKENLLISKDFLKKINAEFYEIDRGGDITYHGPGQMVVYPIFDLENFGIRTREFVNRLEETIIWLLRKYNIQTSRKQGAAGVWLDSQKTSARKICSIGIKSSRGATMHGIALNINTDLKYFSYINPCGFTDKGITSMQIELKKVVDFSAVKKEFMYLIGEIFNSQISYLKANI